jgi:uncharacterized protein YukJ
MKEKAIQLTDNLHGFLLNIKSINEHPYSVGVDVNKLIEDLLAYANDMKSVISEINEAEAPENDQ